MNALSSVRLILAATDAESPSGAKLAWGAPNRADALTVATKNGVAATLETINAFAAGTPIGMASGTATMCYGAARLVMAGIRAGFGRLAEPGAARSDALSGAKYIAAGAAAFFPFVGSVVNGGLALKDTADAVNSATL